MNVSLQTTENLQQQASNPKTSCWVNASAGSGKTKVLIDRIIRLLIQGQKPERILCLTYSRAAANEMQERLLKRLRAMVNFRDDELELYLQDLGEPPTLENLAMAKSLIKAIQRKPVAIQTVHSFCQSLLQQQMGGDMAKPIPRIMENFENKTYLNQAFERLITDPSATDHLEDFLAFHGDQILLSYLSRSIQTSHNSNLQKVKARLHELFDVADAPVFPNPSEEIQKYLKGLLNIDFSTAEPTSDHPFAQAFLTQKMTVRQKILPAAIQKQYPDAETTLKTYGESLCHYFMQKNRYDQVQKSLQFWHLQQLFGKYYREIKQQKNLWDFADLIEKTIELLKLDDFDEILFKLDYQIDHILVDEAQDTSATQWQVIEHLVQGLFAQNSVNKSIFVVGDAKQSIYSFQGADIRIYQSMHQHFETLCTTLGTPWCNVNLATSFRSGTEILALVDRVFASNAEGLGEPPIMHQAFHEFKGGFEALPLVLVVPPDVEPWPIFEGYQEYLESEQALAEQVLDHLHNQLSGGLYLDSTGRNATWDDVMILMRKRGTTMQELTKLCETRKIPYSAFEPIDLLESLDVQDLLACVEFMLMPYNDLNLAGLLKSPWMQSLGVIDEEMLFALCHQREGFLWEKLENQYPAHSKALAKLLETTRVNTYDYFQVAYEAINTECELLDRFMEDVFKRFNLLNLGVRDLVEHLHSYPPIYTTQTTQGGLKISTVHGSKGLEAPIVVILDNGDEASLRQEVVLYDPVGEFWFLKPPKAADTILTESLKHFHQQALEFERNRLFYVALTRAKERIIMGGLDHEQSDNSWYWRVCGKD